MRKSAGHVKESLAKYYDRRRVLSELEERPPDLCLDEELRRQILEGKRTRRLQNISLKLDPTQIQALKKIATMKAIPYQILIRQWLAEGIRRELRITSECQIR
jgi:predicted DNA binding CopG/RHH family protein